MYGEHQACMGEYLHSLDGSLVEDVRQPFVHRRPNAEQEVVAPGRQADGCARLDLLDLMPQIWT